MQQQRQAPVQQQQQITVRPSLESEIKKYSYGIIGQLGARQMTRFRYDRGKGAYWDDEATAGRTTTRWICGMDDKDEVVEEGDEEEVEVEDV